MSRRERVMVESSSSSIADTFARARPDGKSHDILGLTIFLDGIGRLWDWLELIRPRSPRSPAGCDLLPPGTLGSGFGVLGQGGLNKSTLVEITKDVGPLPGSGSGASGPFGSVLLGAFRVLRSASQVAGYLE